MQLATLLKFYIPLTEIQFIILFSGINYSGKSEMALLETGGHWFQKIFSVTLITPVDIYSYYIVHCNLLLKAVGFIISQLLLTVIPVAPTVQHRAPVKRFVSLQFRNTNTVGTTLWTWDQPVARPLPTQGNTNTQQTQTFMLWMGFELKIPASERAKTVHPLDYAAIVIGTRNNTIHIFKSRRSFNPLKMLFSQQEPYLFSYISIKFKTVLKWYLRHVVNK
jgi:hypothetical protein